MKCCIDVDKNILYHFLFRRSVTVTCKYRTNYYITEVCFMNSIVVLPYKFNSVYFSHVWHGLEAAKVIILSSKFNATAKTAEEKSNITSALT